MPAAHTGASSKISAHLRLLLAQHPTPRWFTSITNMGKRFAPFLPMSLLMSHRLDTIGKAPKIRQPTLVLHGDADELIPFTMGEEVAAALPDAKLVRVARGHHADLFVPGSGASPTADELFDLVCGP